MGLLVFAIIGLVLGLFIGASLSVAPGGPPLTGVIGLTGGLIGGISGAAVIGVNPLEQFFIWAGWLGAIAGAIVLMALYALIAAPGPHPEESSAGSGDATTGR